MKPVSAIITFWENIKIALQALLANKMRTFLTTLGIIIGVLTIVSVASIISGLNKGFAEQISNIGSNILYINRYPWIIMDDWYKYRNRPRITLKEAEFIKSHSQYAEAVAPTTSTSSTLKYMNNSLEDISITGITYEENLVDNFELEEGRYFTPIEIDRKRQVAIIGYEIKEKLFENDDPIGKKIHIGNQKFTVIGVRKKRGKIFGESIDVVVYIPLRTLYAKFGQRRSLQIRVKVKNPDMINDTIEELRFWMRTARALKPSDPDNFSINRQELLLQTYKRLTSGLYIAALGIGTLSLLVGGIGIMNIMLVSVTERRKEIGIRKAIGAKRRTIIAQFLIESSTLCTIGGLIAVILSYFISLLIDKLTPFPASVPLWSVIGGIIFSSFVGIFFGLYPAARAAKMNPIEALRYE
ncbi:MAG: ABC transporter permease [Candidatus Marinimicrobia bacterium]|nr:ABC transporter permease [Candidatus Neomarinimicrobiota bacterium]